MAEYNEKQVRIMEAAEVHFADRGFEGASVREIAESAGVNLAMINYYFGSKEKLMEAVFSHRTAHFTLQLESMVNNKELEPMAKVETLVDTYIDRLLTQQCFHRILVREQMMRSNHTIVDQLVKMKKTNHNLIKALITQGQKKGLFRKNIDVSLLMATLVGTVGHVVSTQHYYKETNDLQDMSDEEFKKYIRKKLSVHVKAIFKAILSNED
ncbi:MAG: TetR/AcrR family transcriptional regulator [Chitinophagaceae bacterium]|nr:MAG: TetR/AcrR family transcriptional regulator [Chitinophagaceae bacterium]